MEDETPTSAEETVGAPGTVEAASETGAPATPPDGYIESKRYEDLRSNHDRINSLVDRARQGDSEALKELTGYEFAESEQETEPETDQPDPIASLEQRLAAQEERDQQRAAQESVNQFNADLDKLASEKGAKLSQRERQAVYLETLQAGGSSDSLQKAFNDLLEERKAYDQAVIDGYVKSKRSTHVSPGGTGATETPFRADMTLDERIAAAQERARLSVEQ